MATRNSVARLIPGNPLGSILRETAREARRTSRRSNGQDGADGQDGATGATGPAGTPAPTPKIQYTTQVISGASGFFSWTFPAPFAVVPHLFATVVDGSPRYVSIYLPTVSGTQGLVWDYIGPTGLSGIPVNLLAIEP